MIVFKDWLESTAFIHEDLLAQANPKFQNSEKPKTSSFASNADESTKPKNLECPFKEGQHAIWSCEKIKSMKLTKRREHVQKFRQCFNCMRPRHRSKDCKSKTCSVPNCGRRYNKLLHSDFSKKEATTAASDATTAVATMNTKGGLSVVRIILVNGKHNQRVLAMCGRGSSISFVDKSIVSTLQLQGRKASLSVARIHRSQDVKAEIVPIAVSAHEKYQPLTTVQFYIHGQLKLGNQIVDLQGLEDRYPHLENIPES